MSTCRIVNTVIVRIELGYIDIILLQYKLIYLKEIAFLKGGFVRTQRASLATGLGTIALGAACKKYIHAEILQLYQILFHITNKCKVVQVLSRQRVIL